MNGILTITTKWFAQKAKERVQKDKDTYLIPATFGWQVCFSLSKTQHSIPSKGKSDAEHVSILQNSLLLLVLVLRIFYRLKYPDFDFGKWERENVELSTILHRCCLQIFGLLHIFDVRIEETIPWVLLRNRSNAFLKWCGGSPRSAEKQGAGSLITRRAPLVQPEGHRRNMAERDFLGNSTMVAVKSDHGQKTTIIALNFIVFYIYLFRLY